MDLKELIAFRTIVKEGTFSKAATTLHYAQSTITNQIQRLEKELGIQLFNRGWEAELTPAGRLFAEEVDDLIKHWQFVSEHAKALQKDEIGVINIGIIEPLTIKLPAVLERFRKEKPKISCNFIIGNSDSLVASLKQNAIDFAICAESSQHTSFSFESLYKERITFIAPKNHSLASLEKKLKLEEICAYPLVVGGENCVYQMKLEKEFVKLLHKPFHYSVSQLSSIPVFAKQIEAVGVIVSSIPLPDDFREIDIELENPFIPIGILENIKNEYVSSSKRLFLQLLREHLHQ